MTVSENNTPKVAQRLVDIAEERFDKEKSIPVVLDAAVAQLKEEGLWQAAVDLFTERAIAAELLMRFDPKMSHLKSSRGLSLLDWVE